MSGPAEAVAFLPAQRPINVEAPSLPTPAAGFDGWLVQALHSVNSGLVRADEALQQLATGEIQNLHQVMIALEEARLDLQLLVQVRNRLLDAYQEVLRMQV